VKRTSYFEEKVEVNYTKA